MKSACRICILSALILFTAAFSVAPVSAEEAPDEDYSYVLADSGEIIGDVDGDGVQATPRDAMFLARYLAGWEGYADTISPEAADTDGDGSVTIKDALIMSRYLAGWDGYKAYFVEEPDGFIANGKCGDALYWRILDGGTLEIYGVGDMWDYDYENNIAPWMDHREEISGLVLKPGMISIGSYAFSSLYNIKGDLHIPAGVRSIGKYAFSRCTGFDGTLNIPDSVLYIGEMAFYKCAYLTGELKLPPNLKSIESCAFYDCFNLTGDLTIPYGVERIGLDAFWSCVGFEGTVFIPETVTVIEGGAFSWCEGISGVIISGNVNTIGEYAFNYCKNLLYAAFHHDAPTSFGEGVFDNTGEDFIIYCQSGTAGWTEPTWNGYRTVIQ